ncbi:hypothetical protein [Sphingopyxis chilensis]|uniref:hypothetical protein n=1 Tax=Sphingopyxis chilensis TaxID=180400 RepID=UPI002DDDA22A|nr:hypothetical protein [Sphingopyxis chilensis]
MRGGSKSVAGKQANGAATGSNCLLAAPLRAAVTGREADPGGEARWRLVERRLLSPARGDAVECLVRLERADGLPGRWRAGDLVELRDSFDPGPGDDDTFAASFRPSRHAGVSLLAGGWPAGDWARSTGGSRRLPIASGAGSATLDLLVFSGQNASPEIDNQIRQQLLVGTTVDLRVIPSPARWNADDPLIFIGDFGAAALARAFAQEHQEGELIFLIEAGRGGHSLSPQAILGRECWRDGTVGAMPALGDMAGLAAMLVAHRRKIRSLLDNGSRLIVAGIAPEFLSLVFAGLTSLLGGEALAALKAQGRLQQIALS